MRKVIIIIVVLHAAFGFSQESLSELLRANNSEAVPYMSVEDLSKQNHITILDARESSEYKVSHIKNAVHVGYDHFRLKKTLKQLKDKKQTIVVYCSLGIRSEDIAEKLKKAGCSDVYNLYGGIFEWKNNDLKVYDSEDTETEKVHTFNEAWSKWLKKGIKVYD